MDRSGHACRDSRRDLAKKGGGALRTCLSMNRRQTLEGIQGHCSHGGVSTDGGARGPNQQAGAGCGWGLGGRPGGRLRREAAASSGELAARDVSLARGGGWVGEGGVLALCGRAVGGGVAQAWGGESPAGPPPCGEPRGERRRSCWRSAAVRWGVSEPRPLEAVLEMSACAQLTAHDRHHTAAHRWAV